MKIRWCALTALAALVFVAPAAADAPPISACSTSERTFVANPNVVIPDDSVITSTVEVSGVNFLGTPGKIWDVDLRTFIRHPHADDLSITLQSPSGTIVSITTNNGGTADNVFNGTLFDDGANPGGEAPYIFNNGLATDHQYQNDVVATPLVPEEGLIAFKNEDPNGIWTLTIHDLEGDDQGRLVSWELIITAVPLEVTGEPSETVVEVNEPIPNNSLLVSTADLPAGTICDMSVRLDITHTNPQDLDITLTSPSGKTATITTDNGGGADHVFAGTTFAPLNDLGSQVPYTINPNIVSDHGYTQLVPSELITPEESFAVFYGDEQAGTWTLRVSDDQESEGGPPPIVHTGMLRSWAISTVPCPVPVGDDDGDIVDSVCELCPNDPNKVAPGICGCGTLDVDSDSDGVIDCLEQCAPGEQKGICGCGVAVVDTDGDGTPNCNDGCPNDPAKTFPAACGCGLPDVDLDGNGVIDCLEGPTVEEELESKLADIRKLLRKLKLNASRKKQRTARKALLSSLKELRDFTRTNVFTLSDPTVNLDKLVSQARKNAKRAAKFDGGTFKKSKRGATKALKRIEKALA